MLELPLFPLNTVLFPGTPLHLHIFEERYKRMINLCLQTRQPFGVVLIRKGLEALGPLAEPYTIGCSARILDVQRLEEGRLNLVAVGEDRFRTISLDTQANPYLVGTVEPYPLSTAAPFAIKEYGSQLQAWVKRYLRKLIEAGVGQFDLQQLPSEPIPLAYAAASLVQLAPEQKQELLEIEQAEELLRRVLGIYRREAALLKPLLSSGRAEQGSFSRNEPERETHIVYQRSQP